MTMLGERFIGGIVYEVVWSGELDAKESCPSLLDDFPRGSTLTESVLSPIKRGSDHLTYRHRVHKIAIERTPS